MARIFLLLAVVLGMFWWLRNRAEERLRAERRAARSARPSPDDGSASEAMVPCASCGVHLPRSEAIAYRGLHYCRRSHLPDDSGPPA
ncbi:hypothetical protein BKK79_13655 [Cupriavidus sp. USMAA2-4]|uniref:MYND finger n=1 Tax=Cupriavidus malaysiensis TaxID=367825 RepID=A0A1D9I6K7_9BURK|nr:MULTISPECIES: PP0621 family protein [Cupriavidus]AOY92701.1 hypothetical protein BKK79_13655 [Cupriavidus sp. USMAA2-4]AOZ00825.1 hypothetical protein BKK81_17385 [Cupriavidus sp. USMAHM13]AOZ07585.1 hypothetical protein BKK80_18395 [Cupriavidus malaysiensis]